LEVLKPVQPLNRSTTSVPSWPVRVVQFGAGNFLRAFADWMIDHLNERAGFDGSVVAVKLRPQGSYLALEHQDGLFHVIVRGLRDGNKLTETRLVRVISGAVNPHVDYGAFLELAKLPELRFVISNSTESGIRFEAGSGRPPTTFPAQLTRLLHARFEHFAGAPESGMILLPCELIEDNAQTLKRVIHAHAEAWGLGRSFSCWLDDHNTFCNTLVDRIVPGYPQKEAGALCERLGFEDDLLVEAEPYFLWAIEGDEEIERALGTNRTELNVRFTSDLSLYRTRKVRILNGAHTAMMPVAYLAGLRSVRESVQDAAVGTFVRGLLFEEILPCMSDSQQELRDYAESVLERFANPFIAHQLSAIGLNSIDKFRVRLLPSLLAYHARDGGLPERICYAFASLISFYRGEFRGEELPLQDAPQIVEAFRSAWRAPTTRDVVMRVLDAGVWGEDLSALPGLADKLTWQLEVIAERGIRASLP
jgi:tagaturonate reductase